MEKKLKTYVLMLSKHFPAGHSRAGEPTGFAEALKANLRRMECDEECRCVDFGECVQCLKYHTLRMNADVWEKRASEINAGRAVLSVREWSGRPYEKGGHQREVVRLTRLGIQRVTLLYAWSASSKVYLPAFAEVESGQNKKIVEIFKLASNDGLSVEDFNNWFASKCPRSHFAILHFTSMRY